MTAIKERPEPGEETQGISPVANRIKKMMGLLTYKYVDRCDAVSIDVLAQRGCQTGDHIRGNSDDTDPTSHLRHICSQRAATKKISSRHESCALAFLGSHGEEGRTSSRTCLTRVGGGSAAVHVGSCAPVLCIARDMKLQAHVQRVVVVLCAR